MDKIYTWSPLWCGVTHEHRPHTTLHTPLISTTKHLPCRLQTNFKKFQMKTKLEWPNVSMEVVCSGHCGDRNEEHLLATKREGAREIDHLLACAWETSTERERERERPSVRKRHSVKESQIPKSFLDYRSQMLWFKTDLKTPQTDWKTDWLALSHFLP